MSTLLALKRPFIWLQRFRNRCGYGVHSPFAFELITCVIYEKGQYYAYDYIEGNAAKANNPAQAEELSKRAIKVNRLLFRLANRVQPDVIVDAGTPGLSASYLQAARRKATYMAIGNLDKAPFDSSLNVDFLYLHNYKDPAFVEKAFYTFLSNISSKSVFVIQGIQYSKPMRQLWERILSDDRVGITFDLYDLGIIYFDKSKIKQHYTVNF